MSDADAFLREDLANRFAAATKDKEEVAKKLETVTKDRDDLLAIVTRLVKAVDSGAFLTDLHWITADGRALTRKNR